jgi:prepilin-type N-terminal cleavage/methylation domain-containing protein
MTGRTRTSSSNHPQRRGFTLTEVTVATVVLAAAIVAVTQLMATVAARRGAAEREALARQETANLMEHLFAMPWPELNEQRVAELQLSAACREAMADPQLNVTVESVPGTPAGRQIRVELSWLDGGAPYRRQMSLSAWRFAAEEGNP